MMNANAIFFAWDRPIAGRETLSGEHFADFVNYLTRLQRDGQIQSFEPMFLEPGGGNFNGCFVVRGEPSRLRQIHDSEDFLRHTFRAGHHLLGLRVSMGHTGEATMSMMQLWSSLIPKQ